jgi:hypothetical protein
VLPALVPPLNTIDPKRSSSICPLGTTGWQHLCPEGLPRLSSNNAVETPSRHHIQSNHTTSSRCRGWLSVWGRDQCVGCSVLRRSRLRRHGGCALRLVSFTSEMVGRYLCSRSMPDSGTMATCSSSTPNQTNYRATAGEGSAGQGRCIGMARSAPPPRRQTVQPASCHIPKPGPCARRRE